MYSEHSKETMNDDAGDQRVSGWSRASTTPASELTAKPSVSEAPAETGTLKRITGMRLRTAAVLGLLLVGCSGVQQARNGSTSDIDVLVFSKTEGFRHDSIESGVASVHELGDEQGFSVTSTENASEFTADNLARYDVVVFLNTTGDVLDASHEAAFEGFIRAGGGYVGVHSAADTEYDWEWYGDLVGGYFESHPATQEADVAVLDPAHPATAHLPSRWTRTDEWYNYQANPRGEVHVMATVVEKSYEGGEMGHDHPIVWAHEYDGGRAFYTGMGHTPESYADPLFQDHLLGGIRWAAGVVDADVGATLTGSYEAVVLDDHTTYPMQLKVADDGRVFWIERTGAVKIWDPTTESTIESAWIPVTDMIEDGLLGIELDPNFAENNWIYLYYTPISEDPNRLSRFTMKDNKVDLDSEVIILEVHMQRENCCHSAGELFFDEEGDLWLTTGDNTGGSAPRTDERPGREHYDAQRTTANTNDLRGKIMQITPQPDGSYTIPEDNLFAGDDDPLTRPEIYTMGMRNPWRFFVDPKTGWVFWGEVGPANQYQEDALDQGQEEFNLAKGPGFFGWPYFIGDNGRYRDYDYETEEYGEWPDPENPINDSPNNTGIRKLPPSQPAWIWYHYGPSERFPEMGVGSISASAGFRYHYDPAQAGPHALPPYYGGKVFLFEWARNWIQEVLIDPATGDPIDIVEFTPENPYTRPVDIELGPDQTLYVLEWGQEFWGQNRDARLLRIDYYGHDRRPPVIAASAEPSSGGTPLQVTFSAEGSESRNGGSLEYAWDFDGDGTIDARTQTASYTYDAPGAYTAHLTVTDGEGMTAEKDVSVTAGN
ncbi:MAG: ThuA domain-containing protein, partial [Rhodothermales bacterium]